MSLKQCTLNGRTIRSLDDLYDQLSGQLPLPAHFGGNLDALWDVLSTDLDGPLEIVWLEADKARKVLGKDFDRVMKVFKDLETERDDFTLKIKRD